MDQLSLFRAFFKKIKSHLKMLISATSYLAPALYSPLSIRFEKGSLWYLANGIFN